MSLTKFGKKLLCFLALIAFGFGLVACTGETTGPSEAKNTAEEHVEDIYNKIFWDASAMMDISSNLTLIENTMYDDTKVSWASSHEDIISVKGVVSRPSYDHEDAVSVNPLDPEEKDRHVQVTLTATIKATYEEDGKEKEAIKYKDFKFTVLCLAEGLQITTIAEAKAAAYQYIYEEMGVAKDLVSNSEVIYNVGVYGKVTAKLNASGCGQFMIHDGTEGIYVYSAQPDLQIGDTVLVFGGVYSYYGNLQIARDVTVSVVEREIEVPEHTEISIEEWENSVADLSQIGYHGGKLYKLYAKLDKVEANVAKDIYKLTDPYTAEVAWIYYKSYSAEQAEILDQYDGKYVYITGVTYDRDSRLLKNHLMWDGGIEEAGEPTLSDEQKLGQVVADVEALAGSYVAGSVLELPVANEEYNATITWTIPEGAPYSAGKFALVNADTTFVATAVVAVNGLEQTVEVEFVVNPIQNVTVAEAMALPVGSTVKLTGTIDVLFSKYGNYYLKDATGSLLVYVGAANGIEVNGETVSVKAGDKVTFVGTTNVFNGCPQIGSIISYEAHEAGEWEMSVPQEVTVADIKAYNLENAPYGQYLMVRGNIVSSGNYFYLADGENQISLYNSNVVEELAAIADTETQATLFVYFYGFQKSDLSGDTRVIFAGREGEYFIGDEEVVLPEVRDYYTIEEAKALATSDGVELTLRGVVTHVGIYSEKYGNFGALIADATGGLYLYRVSGTDAHAKLVVGDLVELNGLMKVYNGLYELCNVTADSITVISSGHEVEVAEMSNELAAQSKVVVLEGATWNGKAFEKEGVTYAYYYSSSWLAEEPELVIGYVYNVKGWVNWYNNAQITPIEAPVVAEVTEHEHIACPTCGLCTDPNCDGTEAEKCQGHTLEMSIADFLAQAESDDVWYKLTGIISGTYNTTYGNFYLVDQNDSSVQVLVYGLTATQVSSNDKSFSTLGLNDGDIVTLMGTRAAYNGTAQVGGPAYYVSHEAGAHVHTECPTCGLCTDPNCDGAETDKCQGHEVEDVVLVEGEAYTISAANADGILYFNGTVSGGRFNGSYNPEEAVSVYVEMTNGLYLIYFMDASNVKQYIVMEDKSAGCSFTTDVAAATIYEWNAELQTLVVEDKDNARAFACQTTSTYKNFSAYATSNTSGYNWGQFTLVSGLETPEPSHEHTACPTCGLCTDPECDGTYGEMCQGHEVAGPTIISISEFLGKAESDDVWYQLTGIISGTYNTTYGNFYLVDQNDSSVQVLVYGLTATQVSSNDKSFASLGLADGYIVTLMGTRDAYNGTAQVGGPAYYITHVIPAHAHTACPECGLCTDPNCDGTEAEKCQGHVVAGETVVSTISFASTAQRTSLSTEQQVWENGGVKLINDKASSTSPVADYSNPVRLYANSSITIEAEGAISQIVITTGGSKYTTALTNSLASVSGITVTTADNVVTITLDTPANSLVIAKLTAQTRFKTMEVTYTA